MGESNHILYGSIPDNWDVKKLIEVCDSAAGVQTGPFGSQLHKSDYRSTGTPIITVEHLGENRIIHEDVPLISDEDKDRLSRYHMKAGDIIFSRVGSVDRSALVRVEEDGWLFSGRCLRVRPDKSKVDSLFLSFFMAQEVFKEHIRRIAVGATMPSINTELLSSVEVLLPPLAEQRRIAHILGTLDDKIELNRRMNATLEAIARALFKSWFVDFDPVRAKASGRPSGLPAELDALFPNSFVDSELGKIPRGWRVGVLRDFAVNQRRTIKPDEMDGDVPYIGLANMPLKSIALDEWEYAVDLQSNKHEFKHGEILFGKLRPYFHKVGVAPIDGVSSTDILVIAPKQKMWKGFVDFHFSSEEVINFVTASSTGTKMPRTNWNDLSSYRVTTPPEKLALAFSLLVSDPIEERIITNIHQSRMLAEVRDMLLSRLMRGENS